VSVWTVVVAAGRGDRYGGAKQYEPLGGRRVLDHALADARAHSDGVVLVVAPERTGDAEPAADVVVSGGTTRSGSVRAGLAALPADAEVVLVHDAARPLAGPALFAAVVAAVRGGADAAVPVVAVTDTIRTVGDAGDGKPGRTLDRASLVAVQTPQGFRADVLRAVHAGEPEGTDDASLVDEHGGVVVTVAGHAANRKITEPLDLEIAGLLLAAHVGEQHR
jgi:2-C-methyl-D-erythritol 4-phosphate cytidylyltransferase